MKCMKKILALLLVLSVLLACGTAVAESDRISFLLLCNEGMNNTGDNVQNTIMALTFDPNDGQIRLLSVTFDTFVEMDGYDMPQLLDRPYRVSGPEGTLAVFNKNFNQNIEHFLSVNYLNLANLIDTLGGVKVDITRAERNALNGMVSSKSNTLKKMADAGLVEQIVIDRIASDYYLDNWGEDTELNGLQAVAFGWLQYDSVYNCCLREGQVISDLFASLSNTINSKAVFYTNDVEAPNFGDDRRVINLDDPTDADMEFMYKLVKPVFDESYNNLSMDDIYGITLALARVAYMASRQGIDVFNNVKYDILPLEAQQPYDKVGGREGHIVDYEANTAAINEFLYGDN